MAKSSAAAQVSTQPATTQLGPVGATTSNQFNDWPQASTLGPLTGLVVRYGEVIDAIQAIYGNVSLPSHGGTGGKPSQVQFAGEPIVTIKGFTGNYFGALQVVQLTFLTIHGKQIGPFGSMANVTNPQPFTLTAPNNEVVAAFFGSIVTHTDGTTYLSSLGATAVEVLQKEGTQGPFGGFNTSTFNDWPAAQYLGPIRGLTIWSGGVIDALQASYNGAVLSKNGGPGGSASQVSFDVTDPLVVVSGTYGNYFGATQILQLKLQTASGKTYGPYGSTSGGTPFTINAGANQIGAFFGGSFMHSDGTEYISSLGATIVGY